MDFSLDTKPVIEINNARLSNDVPDPLRGLSL
jgi:hypothetical protein